MEDGEERERIREDGGRGGDLGGLGRVEEKRGGLGRMEVRDGED